MGIPAWYSALVGLLVGGTVASFGCVLLERIPRGETLTGRSHCVCGRVLPPWENIPVLGYLACRGRASCCGASIPPWYFASELASGLLVAGFGAVLSLWGVLASALALLGAFLSASLIRHRR